MSDFIALYRGWTVAEAELVAVLAEPRLVRRVLAELLGKVENPPSTEDLEHASLALGVVREDYRAAADRKARSWHNARASPRYPCPSVGFRL